MSEVVINKCFGGFGLSHGAVMEYAKRTDLTLYPDVDEISLKIYGEPDDLNEYRGMIGYYKIPPEQYHALKLEIEENGETYKRLNEKDWYFSERDLKRDDPVLVEVVKDLGSKANGDYADLAVVEVPDDVEWEISEYDGSEHVAEAHRVWS